MIFSHSGRFLDKKKTIGISGNLFRISSEFGLFANLPDDLKAARSIKKKGYFKISKQIQSFQDVLKLKHGYLGYLFKRTFQTFFKIPEFLQTIQII